MKEIKRYEIDSNGVASKHVAGLWVHWTDVEELQKELQEARAHLLAAIQLIPEDETIGSLASLAKEARELFNGQDKKTIASLQNALSSAEEHIRHLQRPPTPGVRTVTGHKGANEFVLQFRSITHDADGGLHIGVYLP